MKHLLLFGALLPMTVFAGPEILQFSPEGTVKAVRQVRASFSDDMIPFGDPRAAQDPFEIDCPFQGKGLWADTKNWIYNFDTDLPAGVRCTFRPATRLRTLQGKTIHGKPQYAFSTGGPSIQRTHPWEGTSIVEDQAIILFLDAEPDEETVLKNAYFSVEGIEEKVDLRIIRGADRDKLLKSEAEEEGQKPKAAIIIQAKRFFPPGKSVSLVWGKDIKAKPLQDLKSSWKKWLSVRGLVEKWKGTDLAKTESIQEVKFKVRSEFKVQFSCTRETAGSPCSPLGDMRVMFSSGVPFKTAEKFSMRSISGKLVRPEIPKKIPTEPVQEIVFRAPFSEKSSWQLDLPSNVFDESKRAVSNAREFPLTIKTSEFSPLAKFAANFGILESKPQALLPITLRNLEPQVKARLSSLHDSSIKESLTIQTVRLTKENIQSVLHAITHVGQQDSHEKRQQSVIPRLLAFKGGQPFEITKPEGPKAFEVVGIPLPGPGFYVVELESKILGTNLTGLEKPVFVSAAALVTDLAVHFKQGRESSLAWVTSLSEGKPVGGAKVIVHSCDGGLVAEGYTDANGIARFGPWTAKIPECKYPDYEYNSGLVVAASKSGDFSFTHTHWHQGIEPWRFNVPTVEWEPQVLAAHSILDRSLFRLGETVHMKHLLRKKVQSGFSSAERKEFPKAIVIEHFGSQQKYEFPLIWDASGIAESTWEIPRGAKLGNYSISLRRDSKPQKLLISGEFQVEEFRVPLMKASITGPTEKVIAAKEVPVSLEARFLAGGGAASLPVVLRHRQEPATAEFSEVEGFTLANGPKIIEKRGRRSTTTEKPVRSELTLDNQGSFRAVLKNLKTLDTPSDLRIGMEYRDPNGEIQTANQRIKIWPAKRLVGIKLDSWNTSMDHFKYFLAVVDVNGKKVKGASIDSLLFEHQRISHRKKVVGGLYTYESREVLNPLGKGCSGQTNDQGIFVCEMKAPGSGDIVIQASTRDDTGNVSTAHTDTWVYDKSDWWFEQSPGDRIDLLPEKMRYEPGQKAVFQVRTPFREATALISVEREGVIDAWVTPIDGKKPLIEVPIKPEYAPNVFVSALVVRGRVGDPLPTAFVDLAKPAFKMGLASIKVGWQAHELKVKVVPTKEIYKVREQAEVTVHVARADGTKLDRPTEATIAVVDEGLLELKPNESWNILEAMMNLRPYEVETSTAQSWVIGKRHFGLKAIPQGGGGGVSTARTLFDTLIYWKGRVPFDADGRAVIQFPLNDSITSFKVVAVAHDQRDLFGTGSSSIRTTQELSIFSGLSPVTRMGDHSPATFSIRNSGTETLPVRVALKAEGLRLQNGEKTITLAPNQMQTLTWWIDVPTHLNQIAFEMTAEVVDRPQLKDSLKVVQKIAESVPVRTLQATLMQISAETKLPIETPKSAIPKRGGIDVQWSSSLLSSTKGVEEFMASYPYGCLEQRFSKAVALRDIALWNRASDDTPSYLDSDGLARFFPSSTETVRGSVALTAYLLSISHEASRILGKEFSLSEPTRERMLSGLRAFYAGELGNRTEDLGFADLTFRKLMALDAMSRFRDIGFAVSATIDIQPQLWPTSAVLDWIGFLSRAKAEEKRDTRLKEALQILQSRLEFQGTTLTLSNETQDRLWWLMSSGDQNAARILLSTSTKEDAAKLARALLFRMKKGHWDTTLGNAWGTLAMQSFSKAFETEKVQGTSTSTLGSTSPQTNNWKTATTVVSHDWPVGKGELTLQHNGTGAPWALVTSRAAVPLTKPFENGYKIEKKVEAVSRKKSGQWTQGDIVRVKLSLEAQSDRTWVVVDDPIPAGASILGRGLGGDAGLGLPAGGSSISSAFEERGSEKFRAYFSWVPKGAWTVEYTYRLNQPGKASLPPTRVEAMYSPENFSEIPNADMRIEE